MAVLLTVALLLLAAAASALLRVLRPQFRFGWLLAIGMTGVGLMSVLLWQPALPISVTVPLWQPMPAFTARSLFSVNSLTWPYAVGLVTLALAVLLTAPARPGFPDPTRWAISLTFAALGLLAVASADALTLAMVWSALDLAEAFLMLIWSDDHVLNERALTVLLMRIGGISLVLLTRVLGATSAGGEFSAVPRPDGVLLIAAAALHLGALPFSVPHNSAPFLKGGVGITMHLAAATSSLALLARIPSSSLDGPFVPIFLVVSTMAAVYAGVMWLRAPDAFSGRAFWLVGLASLALGSALRGNPAGATAWGVALIFGEGSLLLSSLQNVWLDRAILIGAWTMSALPFSLTARAWLTASGDLEWSLPLFLVAQALLIAGFLHHAMRPTSRLRADTAAWVMTAYPAGIMLLVGVPGLLGIWGWDGSLQIGAWLAAIVVALIAAGLIWAKGRIPALSPVPRDWLPSQSAGIGNWTRQEFVRLYRGAQRISETVTAVLEGEAGIMWGLVLLALFVSLIVGRKP